MSKKISIGIDPGKDGGFSIIWDNGLIDCYAWDDDAFVSAMRGVYIVARPDELLLRPKVACCVEKVGAMPGQGVTSMFSFGKSLGFIEGVLQAYHISYQLVPPAKWKKEFSLNSSKQKSVEICKKLFPNVNLRRTEKCKKDHDGMAESLLMAEFARRRLS